MSSFSKLNIKPKINHFVGDKIALSKILDKEIIINEYKISKSKYDENIPRLDLQIVFKEEPRVVWTIGKYLIQMIEEMPKEEFPLTTKIIEINGYLKFE